MRYDPHAIAFAAEARALGEQLAAGAITSNQFLDGVEEARARHWPETRAEESTPRSRVGASRDQGEGVSSSTLSPTYTV